MDSGVPKSAAAGSADERKGAGQENCEARADNPLKSPSCLMTHGAEDAGEYAVCAADSPSHLFTDGIRDNMNFSARMTKSSEIAMAGR